MSTTTTKLYLRFTSDTGNDRTWSFQYLDTTLSDNNAKMLANTFITNNIAFKQSYQPVEIVSIWREEIRKTEYDIS